MGLPLAPLRAGAAPAARAAADAERHLLRLLKEIGARRALTLLPPPLAEAVRGLREVALLLAGPSLGR